MHSRRQLESDIRLAILHVKLCQNFLKGSGLMPLDWLHEERSLKAGTEKLSFLWQAHEEMYGTEDNRL